MGWLKDYRQANFRGIEFFVPTSNTSGGRRTAIFEFPKLDIPYVEDMGRKARTFTVDALIIGEDYMTVQKKLIQALEKPGKGKLIHPYQGSLDVICLNYTFSERSRDGRMVAFSMNFIEAGVKQSPKAIIDTTSDVAIKKEVALEASKSAYVKSVETLALVQTEYDNLLITIDKSLDSMDEVKRTVSSISRYQRDFENLKARLVATVLSAQELVDDITSLMTFGTNADDDGAEVDASNANGQLDEMRNLFGVEGDDAVSDNDPSPLFSEYFQQNALINAMGLMSIVEYDSVDQADEIRAIIYAKLESFLITVTDDDTYIALYDLQTSVTRDLELRAQDLPRLGEFTPNNSLPAIVIAYSLYGNIDEEADIIARNKINNPNFVPGGIPLEVKIDA